MAEIFKKESLKDEAPKERLLPSVSRARGEELHSPIDTLGRTASHIRLTSESTLSGGARAMARADSNMAIAKNVSDLRLEGSAPVRERFRQLLNALG